MLRLKVHISGANEVLRALAKLPKDATDELRDRTLNVSKILAERIRAAGTSDTPQSARAARSVEAVRDRVPAVMAGRRGGKKVRGVLFGSEFGMTRKSGWYRRVRYFDSRGRQFREHLGAHSYWFFRTAEREQPWMSAQWHDVAAEVTRKWSA